MLEGKLLDRRAGVYPCWGVLPMSFTWSLYIAQAINQDVATRSCPSLTGTRLSDLGPPLVFKVGKGPPRPQGPLAHYVYVDNLGVLAVAKQEVIDTLNALETGFNETGLLLHKSEIQSGDIQALGAMLNGSEMTTRVSDSRYWTVHRGIEALLRRRQVAGWALEVVLGHCTFVGLCSRGVLSTFHTVYAFVRENYLTAVPLWQECREELETFRGLMPFLEARWDAQWSSRVLQCDSSLSGYAVSVAEWPLGHVQETGRISERKRFKKKGPHSARESALEQAGFEQGDDGRWGVRSEDAAVQAELDKWEVDP